MRQHETAEGIRIFVGPARPDREHFLSRALQDLRNEMQDVADAKIDSHRIPRRADTEGIDMFVGETFHHVGGGSTTSRIS